MKVLLALVLLTSLAFAQAPAPSAPPAPPAAPVRHLPALDTLLDPELEAAFATIPVQEVGRIKPLSNIAAFRLLRFHGVRSISISSTSTSKGQPLNDPATGKPMLDAKGKVPRLTPMKWLLLCWFRPDIAKLVPTFMIDSPTVLAELGLDPTKFSDGNGRVICSFNDLTDKRDLLADKRDSYAEIPPKQQTPEQRLMIQLGSNMLDFEMTTGHFDFVRIPLGASPTGLPAGVEAGTPEKPLRLSAALPKIVEALKSGTPPLQFPWFRPFAQGGLGAMMTGNGEQQLRIFPPAVDAKSDVWGGPGETIFATFQKGAAPDAAMTAWLAAYEDIYLAQPDLAAMKKATLAFNAKASAAAAARGEGKWVATEEKFIRADYFFKGQWLFLLGFIFVAMSWAAPQSKGGKVLTGLAWITLSYATYLVTHGIVIRCLIMQRAPITTLYETMLFIGTAGALFGLIAEALTRRGIGLLIAAVSGTACFYMAVQFEASEAADTLQLLQAVLITNFWLSTHVPMINLGYAASLVAAVISMVYFAKRIVGALKTNDEDARFLGRLSYGFLGAGLFLSLVGTVLGGIWANYSWGRFWGWDPKENGALMIVLMTLVILHARLGGYIREAGLHVCNLILGMIVIFSWFAVNQLGVGLHAYGFTDGVWPKIHGYWGSQLLLIGYGLYCSWQDKQRRASQPKAMPELDATPEAA